MSAKDKLALDISVIEENAARFAREHGVTINTTIIAPQAFGEEAVVFTKGQEHTNAEQRELAGVASYHNLTTVGN